MLFRAFLFFKITKSTVMPLGFLCWQPFLSNCH